MNERNAASPAALLPCPFCSGKATKNSKNDSAAGFGILCLTCGATAVNSIWWNTRSNAGSHRQEEAEG